MVTISKRIEMVEQELGGRGGCPVCWGWDVNWDVERVVVTGDAPTPKPTTCPRCGRQPKTLFVRRYGFDLEAI